MFQRISLALLIVSGLIFLVAGSRIGSPGGGVLAEIAGGGGIQTTITLVNLESLPAPYTLTFYDDNGNPLTLGTTAGAPSSQLTGILSSGRSTGNHAVGAGAW